MSAKLYRIIAVTEGSLPSNMVLYAPRYRTSCNAGNRIGYDKRHHRTYWRLLDAAEEKADWREAVAIIFGIDPAAEPTRARLVHDTHLARARWMSKTGYRQLL